VALATGPGRGIGRAISIGPAEAVAAVGLPARSVDELEEVEKSTNPRPCGPLAPTTSVDSAHSATVRSVNLDGVFTTTPRVLPAMVEGPDRGLQATTTGRSGLSTMPDTARRPWRRDVTPKIDDKRREPS
jgi:NADP-dependent 3-hydroxy acid dehydrogenase YdfG